MALIGAALLLPVWLVRYPPLLDYPNHLARSFVLAHLNDPAFHFRGFYPAEWVPIPTLAWISRSSLCSASYQPRWPVKSSSACACSQFPWPPGGSCDKRIRGTTRWRSGDSSSPTTPSSSKVS